MNSYFSVLLLSVIQLAQISSYDIILDKIEVISGLKKEGVYHFEELRVKKFNRTIFAINTQFGLFVDIDNSYTVSYLH